MRQIHEILEVYPEEEKKDLQRKIVNQIVPVIDMVWDRLLCSEKDIRDYCEYNVPILRRLPIAIHDEIMNVLVYECKLILNDGINIDEMDFNIR